MIDHMIIMFTQSKVGWGVLGVIGVVAGLFAVYYISFAIYLIVASIYSGVKLIPESYRAWRADLADIATRAFANLLTAAGKMSNVCVVVSDLAATYDTSWSGAELGVTMPDGGEPVEEEKKKKEKEEEMPS